MTKAENKKRRAFRHPWSHRLNRLPRGLYQFSHLPRIGRVRCLELKKVKAAPNTALNILSLGIFTWNRALRRDDLRLLPHAEWQQRIRFRIYLPNFQRAARYRPVIQALRLADAADKATFFPQFRLMCGSRYCRNNIEQYTQKLNSLDSDMPRDFLSSKASGRTRLSSPYFALVALSEYIAIPETRSNRILERSFFVN